LGNQGARERHQATFESSLILAGQWVPAFNSPFYSNSRDKYLLEKEIWPLIIEKVCFFGKYLRTMPARDVL
jgi:hypothetical protein